MSKKRQDKREQIEQAMPEVAGEDRTTNAPPYRELLMRVNDLLSYASGLKPVAIEPTPDPNKPDCEFRPHPGSVQLTDAQESGFLAREHHVIRLADCCKVSERIVCPHPLGWCKTGFSDRSGWLGRDEFRADLSHWQDRIGGFRLVVAELTEEAPSAERTGEAMDDSDSEGNQGPAPQASENSANISALFPKGPPKGADLRDLVVELDFERTKSKAERRSMDQVALEFFEETRENWKDTKAKKYVARISMGRQRGTINLDWPKD